jgi:peptide chain release factor 2
MVVEPITQADRLLEDAEVLVDLGADDPAAVEGDLAALDQKLGALLDRLEFQVMLGGEHDGLNAIVTLQAGAGGVDACDWSEMLMRMYLRWAEDQGF